jgi:hypothetical protein
MGGNGSNGGAQSGERPVFPEDADGCAFPDEELNAAAAPFLYLLGSLLIAAGGYLIYSML